MIIRFHFRVFIHLIFQLKLYYYVVDLLFIP